MDFRTRFAFVALSRHDLLPSARLWLVFSPGAPLRTERSDRVLLVDDLIATGGTAGAAIRLLERAGANVVLCSFVVDLPDLGGAAKLRAMGMEVVSLVAFDGH